MSNTETMTPVEKFTAFLFQHGLEGYDGTEPTNLGGAKLWVSTLGTNRSTLVVLNKTFERTLRDIQANIITTSRAELDEDGDTVNLPRGGTKRVGHGIILYPHEPNPANTKQMMARIIEAHPEFEKHKIIARASSLREKCPEVEALGQFTIANFLGIQEPIDLSCAIILALPSGPPSSNAYWTIRSANNAMSRAGMTSRTAVQPDDIQAFDGSDLPF